MDIIKIARYTFIVALGIIMLYLIMLHSADSVKYDKSREEVTLDFVKMILIISPLFLYAFITRNLSDKGYPQPYSSFSKGRKIFGSILGIYVSMIGLVFLFNAAGAAGPDEEMENSILLKTFFSLFGAILFFYPLVASSYSKQD